MEQEECKLQARLRRQGDPSQKIMEKCSEGWPGDSWVKVPTTKPAHLSLIPGTHVVEGDDILTPVSCPFIFIGILW